MKTLKLLFKICFVSCLIIIFYNDIKAQKWDKLMPYSIYAEDKDHDTSKVKVGIGIMHPTEKLDIFGNVKIKGAIFVDSIKMQGPLIIGDSLIAIHNASWGFPDRTHTSNGRYTFIRGGSSPFPPLNFSSIVLGVGIQNPMHKLHLSDHNSISGILNPVHIAFTNWSTTGGTEETATDGFLVGIAANSTAELKQQEAQDMQFYTAGSAASNSRMIIKGLAGATQGFVGIGNGFTLPRSHLHLNNNQPIVTLLPNSVYTQFTNTTTGTAATDGIIR